MLFKQLGPYWGSEVGSSTPFEEFFPDRCLHLHELLLGLFASLLHFWHWMISIHPNKPALEVTQHRTPPILFMKVKPFKQVFWMCKHRFFGPNFKMNDRVVHFLVHEYFLSSFSSQFHSYWHFQLVYHYTGSVLVTVHTRSES